MEKKYSDEMVASFKEAAAPLVKWLCENCHPHVYVIVKPTRAELVEGQIAVKIDDFIRD